MDQSNSLDLLNNKREIIRKDLEVSMNKIECVDEMQIECVDNYVAFHLIYQKKKASYIASEKKYEEELKKRQDRIIAVSGVPKKNKVSRTVFC